MRKPPQPPDELPLAALFEPADRGQWRELVAAGLRESGLISPGALADDVEAVLSTITYDGVRVQPLYTAADVLGLPVTGSGVTSRVSPTGWDVRQRHANPHPQKSREAVMADLENGVTSVWLAIGAAGLPLGCLDDVLRDVHLDLAPVVLDAGRDSEAAADEFFTVMARRGVDAGSVRANLGADPIGGNAVENLGVISRLARRCLAEAPGVRAVTVDATVYHDAGGSDADELGASLATGVAYLRELTSAGLSLDEAFGQLEFRYAATADQFLTIAKFRAARQLWARVAEVCGIGPGVGQGPGPQLQHAVTSSAMMTRRDPWVNLLRTTLACFGAGVGGAGAITVQPFDAALGLPDGFSRRIARNTSSLLVMESQVARVIDPAGGSWYVERLTADLAAAGWDWFTEIERAGGIVTGLESGLIGQRLERTWARRADNLAHRRDPITGVSEYPNLAEQPVIRSPFPEAKLPPSQAGQGSPPLPQHRYAEAYEALRDDADAHAAAVAERGGDRAAVFLATIGPVSASTARAGFAGNLFQAGGLATPTSGAGSDPAAIAASFGASGARVACLASSDRMYAEHAVAVAKALKKAAAQAVWLAGRPGERAEEYAAAGIDGYVFAGVNAIDVLRDVHRQIGITP